MELYRHFIPIIFAALERPIKTTLGGLDLLKGSSSLELCYNQSFSAIVLGSNTSIDPDIVSNWNR